MHEDDSNDFYPIILTAPQSDSSTSMDLDELLPIERQMLNNSSSMLSSKSNREVSFSGKDSVVFIESSEDWTDEERDNSWFAAQELDRIKRRAIKLCKQEAQGRPMSPDDSTRGMSIYFPARKKAYARFAYYVLLAYYEQHVGNPDYVAHLAEKWSTANKEMAHTIAVRDMYEAYFPTMLEQQPKQKHDSSGVYLPSSSQASPSPSPVSHVAVSVNAKGFLNRPH